MATTFATFKASLKKWIWRDDDEDLDDNVALITTLAESRLNNDLRHPKQVSTSSITYTAGTPAALPADFLEGITLSSGTPGQSSFREYRLLSQDQFDQIRAQSGWTGSWFTIIGTTFEIRPEPETTETISLRYYARVPTFSTADPSETWVYEDHPRLYLYACLAEAADFIQEDRLVTTYEAKYAAELTAVRRLNQDQQYSGGRLVARVRPFSRSRPTVRP